MVISVKHKFNSTKADSTDSSLIRPSNWNDEHNLTLAGSRLLGRANSTAGAAQEVSVGNGLRFAGTALEIDPSEIQTSLNFDQAPYLPLVTSTGGGINVNTLDSPGWQERLVRASSEQNAPPAGTSYFHLLNLQYGGSNLLQLAFPYTPTGSATDGSHSIWARRRSSGTWGSWFEIGVNLARIESLIYGYAVPTNRTISAGSGLSGGGNLNSNRTITLGTPGSITNSSSNNVTSSGHTHALGFTAAEVYRSSTTNATNLPIGHTIAAWRNTGHANRNSSPNLTVRLHQSNNTEYQLAGTNDILSGDWRSRGFIGDFILLQRVS